MEVAAADPSGETWHELTDILSEEASRMHYLVEDLLTLANANDGGFRLHEEDVDLDDVVDRETRRLGSTSEAGIMSAHHGGIWATESPVGDCRFELVFPGTSG